MTTNNIIVGYDRSPDAHRAALWALDEAARIDASVEFLYAYKWPVWAPAASMVPAPAVWPDGDTDRAIKEGLDQAVADAKQTHPTVRTTVSIVDNAAALTLIDRSAQASLIVVGSRGHSAVAGLLGSVSVAVSAHARCPVIVVRGETRPAAPVVVGVDDSPSAQSALAFAVEQAAQRHVPLTVIRAWAPVSGLWEETAMVKNTVTPDERRPLDEAVAGWQAKYQQVEITAEAVVEHPAAALERASRTAQLLVVGTRGRGAAIGTLLGSVSQHLLHTADCTIAIAHGTRG